MVSDVIVALADVADGFPIGGWLTLANGLEGPLLEPPAPVVRIWDVLATWRAAERALTTIPEGSSDWFRVHADLVGLRAAYHGLVRAEMQIIHPILSLARSGDRMEPTREAQPWKDIEPS